ncbi:hypothetical protein ACFL2O_10790 [Thermodesulfobacteriota bacterium]
MESWQIYSYAIKLLGPAFLQKIYRRSTPLIYTWGAGPFNEKRQKNPIDRITMMLTEFHCIGRDDIARAAIDIQAYPLGGHFTPFEKAISDKGTVDGEAVDSLKALSEFVEACRQAVKDGLITKEEYGNILERLRDLRSEIDQLFSVIQERMGV